MPPGKFRHGRTVVVIRAGGFDDNGDPLPSPGSIEIEGCAWAPRTQGAGASSTSVDDRGRQGLIEGLTLYAPARVEFGHDDRVQLPDGSLFEVDGEVGDWFNPYTGSHPGVEVNLRRAEG